MGLRDEVVPLTESLVNKIGTLYSQTDRGFSIDVGHEQYGALSLAYWLFDNPGYLSAVGLGRLSVERIYYNKLYWAHQFTRVYGQVHGPDASMEQQAFQILERVDELEKPDWAVIHDIVESGQLPGN